MDPLILDVKNNLHNNSNKFEFKENFFCYERRLHILKNKTQLYALQGQHDFLII